MSRRPSRANMLVPLGSSLPAWSLARKELSRASQVRLSPLWRQRLLGKPQKEQPPSQPRELLGRFLLLLVLAWLSAQAHH